MQKIAFFILTILFSGFEHLAFASNDLSPFKNPESKSAKATYQLHTAETRPWIVSLVFPIDPSSNDEEKMKLEKLEEEITGSSILNGAAAHQPHKGVPFRVVWSEMRNGVARTIREREVTEEWPTGIPDGVGLGVDGPVCLSPGDYTINIESMNNDDRLKGMDVAVFVGTTPTSTCTKN
jgi:hypothetical protein